MTTVSDGLYQYGGAPAGAIPGLGGGFPMPAKPRGRVLIVGSSQQYGTIASAVSKAIDGDTILLSPYADYSEDNISTPTGIDHVTVIGMGNVPRATRWKSPANAANPFITVNGTGWVFQNIYFAGGTSGPCIKFLRDASHNASEGRVVGCVFNGGSAHIENTGACSNLAILGNRFINARGGTATTPGAIVCNGTAQAVATNLWIEGNQFYDCDAAIAHSMSRSLIKGNFFQAIGHDGAATNTLNLIFNSAQGDYNTVIWNSLGEAVLNIDTGHGFKDGANSVWSGNLVNDQAAYWYGVPTA